MSNCVAFPLCAVLTLILTHCYSLLAILDKKVLYVEDEPRRNYRLEDFLWTGSGDGEPETSSAWRTTTVFRTTTTTIMLGSPTILIKVTPTVHTSCAGVGCGISATPTLSVGQPFTSAVPPWPPPQPPPPEQRYWLVTVLRANVSKEDLSTAPHNFEPRLARLYKTAFQRQQLHHLGVNGASYQNKMAAAIKRRREERPLTVTVLNATATQQDATLRLVYAVSVNGRPVRAEAAAQDMRLMSDKEVTAELGFPVLLKAEPYLQGPASPFHRDTTQVAHTLYDKWLLISAGVCALLLLLILVVLSVLGLSARSRKRKQRRIDGSANRQRVYSQEQQQRRTKVKGKGKGKGKSEQAGPSSAGEENMAYQHDDNEQGKVIGGDSPDRLSLRSGPSSAASLVRRSAPTPHPRPRPRSRKASPNSFLSMPSVKQFPRGPPIAEPLEQVLQPEASTNQHQGDHHGDACDGVPRSPHNGDHREACHHRDGVPRTRHHEPPSDLPLTRHRSQNEGEDPGVIGPLVWDLHCHRMHKQECQDAEEDISLSEPNVGRMRRRFQELLDDAFSMFGSRSGSPEAESCSSPTAHAQTNQDYRAKSAALVRPVSELLGTETILTRPKTSASAISQRPSTAGGNRGSPRGAWNRSDNSLVPSLVAPGTPSLRPPPRPLSAGPFHRPSLEPSHILSDANLSPSDPVIPLIAAIQEELDKFAPPLPGSPPYKF
ncbi:uncharacterized protein LOC111053578 isoform X2 [Nilaparvata lugens]|uniref:uncharacterized protein LOC111053578 isoform X2 n=1 Tax=Nilaparvata lugens TaxID=108931 RepID=UPI00193E2307|nr:uncharacterized protein LOC111053578 isoform X2 [Nilaparvata lugens]